MSEKSAEENLSILSAWSKLNSLPLETLEKLRLQLISEKESIQAQLSDRNRVAEDGDRLADREFHEWRKRALAALQYKNDQLRTVNVELRTRRGSLYQHRNVDGKVLLAKAHSLLMRLRDEGVDFQPDEIALIEDLGSNSRQ